MNQARIKFCRFSLHVFSAFCCCSFEKFRSKWIESKSINNLRCDETPSSCVNTAKNTCVHEWRLPPLKELTSTTSLLPAFYHCVAATLILSLFPTQPIRFLPSTQPLKPGVSDWCEKGGLRAGGVAPHSLSLRVSF